MIDYTRLDADFSRRDFLKTSVGLSFTIAITSTGSGLLLPNTVRGQDGRQISVWLTISPDNVITIFTPGAEMGQGSMTSVPLILAEEMDADWNQVKLEWAPADANIYGYGENTRSMAISGSRAVSGYFNIMRTAGAQVRKILLHAVAQEWHVPVEELKTESGTVIHTTTKRSVSYGEIVEYARVPPQMPTVSKDDFKKPAEYRLIGHSQPRYDIPAKVNGTAQFSMDVHLPGMLYATTVHSPVQGAQPQSWNESTVNSMKGIRHIIKLPDEGTIIDDEFGLPAGLAIVGDTFVEVMAARSKLKVAWSDAKASGYDSEHALEVDYVRIFNDPDSPSNIVDSIGDVESAFSGAMKTYRSDFFTDYAYHAQMEPLNAVAQINNSGNRVEVWEGTQAPDRCRARVAKALGFSEEQVTINQCYMGGGFGRRTLGDYAVEAALLAHKIKKPIKLIWTREEDIAHGMFRPQNYQHLEAALDASGKVIGWKHCVVGDGGGLISSGMRINSYYQIPSQHIDSYGTTHGIRLKHWRAVSHPHNVFAIEEFVDRMAVSEGIDPIEFRLTKMAMNPRGKKVFEKVAEMSNWHTPRTDGRALGISITERSGSLGAAVVEISLNKDINQIKVHKVWTAIDGGLIVQPDAARANIESGINFGLSSILYERITIKDGVVEQSNYHDYNVMRMSNVPDEIHVEFINSAMGEPYGVGEIGNPPMGAAVSSAFYRLTGKRLSHMPFTSNRIRAALNT